MNKLLTLILVLISLNCYGAMTFQQAKNVWGVLQNISGHHIHLHYDNDEEANAYSGVHGVYITQGMLNDLQTNDQLAMVLGHEMGHYAESHYRAEESTQQELDADRIGYYYCKKMGYKNCLSFLTRMQGLYGDGVGLKGGDVHLKWSERLRRLKK